MSSVERLAQYRQQLIQQTESSALPALSGSSDPSATIRLSFDELHLQLQAFQELPTSRTEDDGDGYSEISDALNPTLMDMMATMSYSGEMLHRQRQIYRELERPGPVTPEEALDESHRMIILGSPGSGKTTLLHYLANLAARDTIRALPILVPLPQYVIQLTREPSTSLLDFALSHAAEGDATLREALAEADSRLWLIDDLDVLHKFREALIRQINELPGELVITSRPHGYHRRGLEALRHFELLPLPPHVVDNFLDTCFISLAQEREAHWDWAEEQSSWLKEQLARRPHIQALCGNPLLLSYLVILCEHDQMEDFPERRTDLYCWYFQRIVELREPLCSPPSSCSESVFHAWQALAKAERRELTIQILYALGWHLHRSHSETCRSYLCTRKAVLKRLCDNASCLQKLSDVVRRQIAEMLIRFWQEAGILEHYQVNNTAYLQFRHRLFQEYAAAQQLHDFCCQDFGRTWKFLVPRLHHYVWQEPLVMLSAILPEDRGNELTVRLLRGVSPYERTLFRDLRLAARFVNEGMQLSEPLRRRLFRNLGKISSASAKKQAGTSPIIYILGLLMLLSIQMFAQQPMSPWTSLNIAVLWSLLWHTAFEISTFPVLQGVLALPLRLWHFIPDRRYIIQVLQYCNAPEVVPYLMQALSDRHEEVKRAAAEALAYLGEVDPIPHLLQLMHESEENVRKIAALALGKIGAIPRLIQALNDNHAGARNAAADALGQIGELQVIPNLAFALQDDREYVRRAAVDTLKQLESEQAVPLLVKALEDSDQEVRLTAAEALGQLKNHKDIYTRLRLVSGLVKVLEDDTPNIRWAAACALGKIQDSDIVPFLIQALRKNTDYVTRAISDALRHTATPSAAPHLIKALKDPNPNVRRTAAETLGRFRGVETVPALVKALEDHNFAVRRDVAEALGTTGSQEAIPALLEHLEDDEWEVRWAVIEALGKIGTPHISPHLIRMMNDSNSYVYRAAVEALGKIGKADTVPYLIRALKSEQAYVRQAAEEALKQLGEAQTVPYVIRALKDEQEYIRKDAEEALKQISDARTVPYLIQALQEPEHNVRRAITEALGRLGSPEAVPHLIPLLNSDHEKIRSTTAKALGNIASSEAVAPLIQTLQDPSGNVRRMAANALGRIGTQEAVVPLLQLMNENNINVRRAVVEALGRIGDPIAVPTLISALQDPEWWVRWSSAYALERISDPRAVPQLIQTLKDSNGTVRRAAAEALGQIGKRDPKAINALIRALADDEWWVRWAATLALGQIGEPIAFSYVLNMLEDRVDKIRWVAVESLGRLGHIKAAPHLIQALQDDHYEVRKAAAGALGQIHDAEVIPYLLQAMREGNAYVRRTTRQALAQIQDVRAVPYLIEALKDSRTLIRQVAAENLLRSGHAQTFPQLLRLFKHGNWRVREIAIVLFGQLVSLCVERSMLRKAARALWWRLTDYDPVAKAAFHSLDQIADQLTVLDVESEPEQTPIE